MAHVSRSESGLLDLLPRDAALHVSKWPDSGRDLYIAAKAARDPSATSIVLCGSRERVDHPAASGRLSQSIGCRYSITSSARSRNDSEMGRTSALAVARLMTASDLLVSPEKTIDRSGPSKRKAKAGAIGG